jgi:hypothetical protein
LTSFPCVLSSPRLPLRRNAVGRSPVVPAKGRTRVGTEVPRGATPRPSRARLIPPPRWWCKPARSRGSSVHRRRGACVLSPTLEATRCRDLPKQVPKFAPPGCGLILRDVALAFSVWQPNVVVRLASRLHLRPSHLAVRTLAYSAWLPSGRLPFQVDCRSWPCVHPRGPRPSIRSVCSRGRRSDRTHTRTSSPEVSRPSGAPSPRYPCPGPSKPAGPEGSAGSVEPRRGVPIPRRPPAPFFTTLTV